MASSEQPQTPKFSTTSSLPHKFGVVLYPGFQNIDVFGPVDVFNGVGWYIPHMEVYFLSHDLKPVTTKALKNKPPFTFGFQITPTHTFSDPPELDVLLVPGGLGAFVGRDDPVLNAARQFVYDTYRSGKIKYLLTVCTGSGLIAPTGVLDGITATSNKRSWDWVVCQSDKVHWKKKARWTHDGNIWTSSGVTAGIDMAFGWVTHVYNGKVKDDQGKVIDDFAQLVADSMEYRRDADANDDPFANRWPHHGGDCEKIKLKRDFVF